MDRPEGQAGARQLNALRTGAILLLALLATLPARAAEIEKRTLTIADGTRTYYLYVPDSAKPAKAPVLLLLHGSYGDGGKMAALWKDIADREGVVLVAPNAAHFDAWRPLIDTPRVLALIINDAGRQTPLDLRRMYLFGHSGGAVYALTLAMMESRAFAAMAVLAGSWRHKNDFKLIDFAQRRIPMKIISGTRDEFFTVASVRATGDGLKAAGFPVEIEIVPGQHHWYDANTAPAVNDSAWTFLKAHALSEAPYFQDYGP